MAEKRKQSKAQLRNLVQHRNKTDEEFEEWFEGKVYSSKTSTDFEERIEKKIKEFSNDYDIDDLKINDREVLRAFVQSIISLEDYEKFLFNIRAEDVTDSNIYVIDRLSKICSDLRKDISKFQDDLNITRKLRKSDKESSVVSYIANLKEQARQYFEQKMSYIFCPECNMLLGNIWCLYPQADNKITLICQRVLNDGSKCNTKVIVTTKELETNGGTNKPSITPDSLL